MSNLWSSKKFKTALFSGAVSFVASYLGFTPEQVLLAIAPFIAYIGGQSLVDAKAKPAKK